jgi:hypothetical protein
MFYDARLDCMSRLMTSEIRLDAYEYLLCSLVLREDLNFYFAVADARIGERRSYWQF